MMAMVVMVVALVHRVVVILTRHLAMCEATVVILGMVQVVEVYVSKIAVAASPQREAAVVVVVPFDVISTTAAPRQATVACFIPGWAVWRRKV